jgi:CBS domain-containing protein
MIKGTDVWSIGPEETVFEALRLMERQGVGALLVMTGDDLVGIISERDYARKIILMGRNSRETKVKDIMTSELITVHPETTLEECMELMTEHRIRHLPVLEGDRVMGIISIGDAVREIIHRQRETIKNMSGRVYGG